MCAVWMSSGLFGPALRARCCFHFLQAAGGGEQCVRARKFWFMHVRLGMGKLLLVPVVQSLGRNPPCGSRHGSLVPEMAWSWQSMRCQGTAVVAALCGQSMGFPGSLRGLGSLGWKIQGLWDAMGGGSNAVWSLHLCRSLKTATGKPSTKSTSCSGSSGT